MSKFLHDDDDADADADDARAMTIPRRFFSKTAELKMQPLQCQSDFSLIWTGGLDYHLK